MSPDEVIRRMRSSLRDRADRFLVSRRQQLRKPSAILNGDGSDAGQVFRVTDVTVENGAGSKTNEKAEKRWYDSLPARAARIAEHRLDLFNLKDKHFGDPIDWYRHHTRWQAVWDAFTDLRNKHVICARRNS